jgi:sugar lactone lactonase YvrE
MRPTVLISLILLTLLGLIVGSCTNQEETRFDYELTEVATSDYQWTGIAVAPDGRMFVNFPNWANQGPLSVAVLDTAGEAIAYPDQRWNDWAPEKDPAEHFVCVQSVVMGADGHLWILDPANPRFEGVVEGGPKLLKVDLETDSIIARYYFSAPTIRPSSYLNDVRIDTTNNVAYITDSGEGALIVLDLNDGSARRLLDEHPSTQADTITLMIGGRPWLRPDGSKPQVHADGIALDLDEDWVYFQALSSRTMYRIGTNFLADTVLTPKDLGEKVQIIGQTGAADGLLFGSDRRVYISSLERDAIMALEMDGEVVIMVQDTLLAWPDSFAEGSDGALYVTCSQIHLGPDPGRPYRIYKVTRAQ